MEPVLRRVVFRIGGREYRWEDVVRAAEFWGELAALRRRVVAAAALADELEASGEETSPEAFATAADEFRYAHDLLTAEDLEDWLRHWDLSLEDWESYLARSLVDVAPIESSDTSEAPNPWPSGLEQKVWTEVVCSGALVAWAERLAARAALWARWQEESPADQDPEADRSSASPADRDDDGEHTRANSATPAGDVFRRRLQAFENAYDRLAARHVTPRAIGDHVARRRADWTRVAGVLLTFASRNEAQEAALLGRDDREPPAAVARLSGADTREGSFFLEDFDASIRERLRGVPPDTWAGPFEAGDRFVLLFVRERIPPLATDPEIRHRAARSLLDALARQEVSRRVTWCQQP